MLRANPARARAWPSFWGGGGGALKVAFHPIEESTTTTEASARQCTTSWFCFPHQYIDSHCANDPLEDVVGNSRVAADRICGATFDSMCICVKMAVDGSIRGAK